MLHHEWPGLVKERIAEVTKAVEQERLAKQARATARDSRGSVIARSAAFVTALFRG